MTIELHDAVDGDGLFDVQGKAFEAMEALLTAALTTVPTKVEAFLAQFQLRSDSDDLDVAETMERLPAAVSSWQSATGTLSGQVRMNLELMLRELVANDASQPEDTIKFALEYLISQMETDGDYVAANTVGLVLTPGGSNTGDLAICYSELRGDGRIQENCLAETLAVTVANAASQQIRLRSPLGQSDLLAHDWPKGSGVDLSLTATDPASSLLSNGDFEDETIDDVPDNWICHVGTPGTTLKVPAVEVQTVTISGTPTGGSYLIQWENADGIVRSTPTLAYNATASTVQAGLRQIPGLGKVTVSSSGISPDYTHTITFTGVTGDPNQLTSVSDLTGGAPAIAHATGTPAHTGAYRGQCLEFDSNGSELTALYHPLTVSVETVYFCHLRVKRVGAAAAGEIRIELVDEIDGTVITDGEGNAARKTLTASAISAAAHDSVWFSFRVPPGTSMPVYLRIRISVAVSNTASIVFDEVAIVQGRSLYPGGPYVAVFAGATLPHPNNTWTLAVSNNRSGSIQEWYNRIFQMDAKGLLLPITGGNLIPKNWT